MLIAALIWLTSAVVFADPLWMNAHAFRIAQHQTERAECDCRRNANTQVGANRDFHGVAEQDRLTPAEGPTPFTVGFDTLDASSSALRWQRRQRRQRTEMTFWSMSLTR